MPIILNVPLDGPAVLDDKRVFVQYHTQRDSHVRPSHAALDGKVFRIGDVEAPVPPTDFGCRCYLTYVAAPDTPVSAILPDAPSAPTSVPVAYAEHLTEIFPKWRDEVAKALQAPPMRRLSLVFAALRAKHPTIPAADLRDFARMALEASRGPAND